MDFHNQISVPILVIDGDNYPLIRGSNGGNYSVISMQVDNSNPNTKRRCMVVNWWADGTQYQSFVDFDTLGVTEILEPDMNTITTPGLYYLYSPFNSPAGRNNNGYLRVTAIGDICLQEYFVYGANNRHFIREKMANSEGGTWSNWTTVGTKTVETGQFPLAAGLTGYAGYQLNNGVVKVNINTVKGITAPANTWVDITGEIDDKLIPINSSTIYGICFFNGWPGMIGFDRANKKIRVYIFSHESVPEYTLYGEATWMIKV